MMASTLSKTQRIALSYGKSVTGVLSCLASACIIHKIYVHYREVQRHRSHSGTVTQGSWRNRCGTTPSFTTLHRMLLGMSMMDIMYSFFFSLATLPVPAAAGAIGAHGTTATCSAQGFFVNFSFAAPLYMASLSFYFVLKIRFNASDASIVRCFEFWMHAVPWGFGFVTGGTALSLKLFNPLLIPELGCWLSPSPRGCYLTPGIACTRGGGFDIPTMTIWFALIPACMACVIVVMNNVLIYASILTQERRNAAYGSSAITSGSQHTITLPDPASAQFGLNTTHVNATGFSQATADIPCGATVPVEGSTDISETYGASNNAAFDLGVVLEEDEEGVIEEQDFSSRRSPSIKHASTKASRTALCQSILYVSFAFVTAFNTVVPVILHERASFDVLAGFIIFAHTVVPSKGIFTLYVYVRLQYKRLRTTQSRWKSLKISLFSSENR